MNQNRRTLLLSSSLAATLAAAGATRDGVARLNDEIKRILQAPEMIERFAKLDPKPQ